jgi:hypothetical protein
MENPLVNQQMSAEKANELALAKAAFARTAGDWFDIFNEITDQSVVSILESHGESPVEDLKEWKADRDAVRREFVAHALPLSENIEIEGPVRHPQHPMNPNMVLWPGGQQLTLHWPDKSKLFFRGRKAVIAFSFILWWDGFQQQFKILTGGPVEQGGQSRMIRPGSKEWKEYWHQKAMDQKGSPT